MIGFPGRVTDREPTCSRAWEKRRDGGDVSLQGWLAREIAGPTREHARGKILDPEGVCTRRRCGTPNLVGPEATILHLYNMYQHLYNMYQSQDT